MNAAKKLNVALAGLMVVGMAAFAGHASPAAASSHREAPMISQDPAADGTDVYAFVSPDKPDTVTLIACYYPFEEPAGGPNYYRFGDDVLYEINVDNVGDAKAHLTYQFRFNTKVGNGNTFLYNTGPIDSIDSPNLNIRQTYSVTLLRDGQSSTLGQDLKVPPVNIGAKSTPNYEALSNQGIQSLSDGTKVFAGQTDDPFFVDLNVFDLLTIRKLPGNAGGGVDGLKGYNVQALALQIPIKNLTKDGATVSGPGAANAVVGVWSTAKRQATRVLDAKGSSSANGDWVQVSRLGAPLVNEVVVPLAAKDLWNASQPSEDAQFLGGVTDPELAKLFNALYKIQVPPAPRDDLVAIFLTGIPGATQPVTATQKPAEELRLNMGVPPSANPNSLGVVGGDLAGYPDGRRLADDVTDISLKAVAGAAYPLFHKDFKADPIAAQLGDGVDTNDVPFRASFPYLAVAHDGTSSVPHGTMAQQGGGASTGTGTGTGATEQPAAGTGGNTGGNTGAMPGMPKTGQPSGLFNIDHLGDVYGLALGAVAGLGGLVLVGGWAMRRKSATETTRK